MAGTSTVEPPLFFILGSSSNWRVWWVAGEAAPHLSGSATAPVNLDLTRPAHGQPF